MSIVDADGHDDGIYRTTFDPSTKPACVAIVEAIEDALGSSASDSVLANSIDPDALQQLYQDGSGSWMLTFDHDGFEITLWGTGRIHVETTRSTASYKTDRRPTDGPTQPTGPTQPAGPTL